MTDLIEDIGDNDQTQKNTQGSEGTNIASSMFLPRMPVFRTSELVGVDVTPTRNHLFGCEHKYSAIQVLVSQYDDQAEFCDATIVIQGQELKAHWCVLVACPYFEALYRSSLTGIKPDKIKLDIASKSVVKEALKCLYTGQADIHSASIMDLITVADFLQITRLRDLCFEFIASNQHKLLNIENCIKLCWLAGTYNNKLNENDKLYQAFYKFLCIHFDDVVAHGDILSVPGDFIMAFITDEKNSFIPCVKLFELITKWTEHDETDRILFFPSLLFSLEPAIVRSHDLTLQATIQDHKFVRDSEDLASFVRDIHVVSASCSLESCFIVENMKGTRETYCVYVINENRWVNIPTPVYPNMAIHQSNIYALNVYSPRCLYTFDLSSDPVNSVHDDALESCDSYLSIYAIKTGGDTKIFALQNQYNKVVLKQLDRSLGKFIDKNRPMLSDAPATGVRSMLINNGHICIIAMNSSTKTAVFSNYGIRLNRVYGCKPPDIDLTKVCYMYEHKNSFVVGEQGAFKALSFDFNMPRPYFRQDRALIVKDCPIGTLLTDRTGGGGGMVKFETFKDCLYSFMNPDGLVNGSGDNKNVSVVQYILASQTWTLIQQTSSPQKVSWKGPRLIQLPSSMLTCHYDCPHCDTPAKGFSSMYAMSLSEDYDEDDDDDDLCGMSDYEDYFHGYSSDEEADAFIRYYAGINDNLW